MGIVEKIKKLPLIKKLITPLQRIKANLYHQQRIKETARFDSFYANVFENVVAGSLVVNVPDYKGQFEIDFRSHILRRLLKNKSYEPESARLILKYIDPDRDILDIGANIGLFTVLMAQHIKNNRKVLAVEPTPLAFSYLVNNCRRNKVDTQVIAFQGFVSNKKSNQPMHVVEGREEYSSLGTLVHPSITGQEVKQINARGDTIDNLVSRHKLKPGFIKIDTEGAEMLVLQGAVNTIRNFQPVIIAECSNLLLSSLGFNSKDILQFFQDNNYSFVFTDDNASAQEKDLSGTILALPKQKI